ncbi:MAG: molybdopterin-dependent oxidoreductase [Microthrixaceae bacterium]|nr:molybdopterin-dependent oxidoreductase [Microthrixaceae bacterium]
MPPLSQVIDSSQERRRAAAAREVHSERLAAQLGLFLGAAFTVCFVTGLISHLHQHPLGWFPLPSSPAGLYRVTQGLHVTTGLAAIPLLLAKLYVVSPQLPRWPPVDDVVDAMARLALLPLVGGSILLLFTGAANIASWYPWDFFFPVGHWWAAWMVMGALMVHVSLQFPAVKRLFTRSDQLNSGDVSDDGRGLSRRGLLGFVVGGAGILTLLTAGQTFPPLRAFTALAPRRPDIGPQGFPVNRTAEAAGTEDLATGDGYALVVVHRDGTEQTLDLAAIRALEQVSRELPIACVEGWSASVKWRGVPLSAVLAAGGVGTEEMEGRTVKVGSAQQRGLYGSSLVEPDLAGRDDCLLALEANGEVLHPDHGAPVRLIAPNRPGVLQTKWVTRLEVL